MIKNVSKLGTFKCLNCGCAMDLMDRTEDKNADRQYVEVSALLDKARGTDCYFQLKSILSGLPLVGNAVSAHTLSPADASPLAIDCTNDCRSEYDPSYSSAYAANYCAEHNIRMSKEQEKFFIKGWEYAIEDWTEFLTDEIEGGSIFE